MRLPFLLPSACLSLLLALALAACAAPSANPEAVGPALPEQSPSPDRAPPAGQAGPVAAAPGRPPSPDQVPRPAGDRPVVLDYSCGSDDDCAVKNVGNCCGYYPACVNRDSPADPAAVQAQCAEEGRVGVCGFPAISSCQCVQGRCEGSNAMLPAL